MASLATPTTARFGLPGFAPHLLAAGAVVLTTAMGMTLDSHLAEADHVMLYLLAIGLTAFAFGRPASVTASGLSVLAFDYAFVEPRFTFAVNDERYLLTFAMMFAVGLTLSGLTLRLREETAEAKARAAEATAASLSARTETMRSALLSTVSHDLRTPLAIIKGAASTLRDARSALDAAETEGLLASIADETDRLERLVGNLLEMTRLESGGLTPKREWLPVEELLASALSRLEDAVAGRPVSIDTPAGLPMLQADPVLLEQVVINLVENAVKYAPSGTPISVSARPEGEAIAIEVSDRGPGIPPGAEQKVFEKFYRGPESNRASGSGLGLAICKGIVEAHGGTITAGNREGGGARFTVRLPVPREQPA
jgi:K+-sensing histidine kinase KdpD